MLFMVKMNVKQNRAVVKFQYFRPKHFFSVFLVFDNQIFAFFKAMLFYN